MQEDIKNLDESLDIYDFFSPRYRALAQVTIQSLRALFAGRSLPGYQVKGTSTQINSFLDTLVKEKSYMSSAIDNGLNDPRTYRQKAILDVAVKNFQRETGQVWPIG
jgi:hypothetical protein